MSERRYEISFRIGPCSEEDADRLACAILDLAEFRAAHGGGVVGMAPADDDVDVSEDASGE